MWGLDDIQVRVLTIDAEPVVQQTVTALPDALADVRVIAETPMDIDGIQVHVVPGTCECTATNKGRAVEWASRNVDAAEEYLLYLDEDTIVTELTGLPDADFVQFTEKPIYTGSRRTYLCEVFRTGYQFEPVENFEVTEKVTADTIETANVLDDSTLAAHEGTERLLRESEDEFETGVFRDDDD